MIWIPSPKPKPYPLDHVASPRSNNALFWNLTKQNLIHSIKSSHLLSAIFYVTQLLYRHKLLGLAGHPITPTTTFITYNQRLSSSRLTCYAGFDSSIDQSIPGWSVEYNRHHSTFTLYPNKRPQRSTPSSTYTQIRYYTNLAPFTRTPHSVSTKPPSHRRTHSAIDAPGPSFTCSYC